MASGRKYFCILLWLSFMYLAGISLFTRGFLLKRLVIEANSTCSRKPKEIDPEINFEKLLFGRNEIFENSGCWLPKRFARAVVIIIDGLRYDFAAWNKSAGIRSLPYQNKLPIIKELMQEKPDQTVLYKFLADPPTTTMQRIKGLTTGSLPTFVDAGANFASYEISEDNIVDQMIANKKRIVFMGDDTWMGLFPKRFHTFLPFPSFNVKDLDTVDNGILEHLVPTIKQDDWDVIFAHFLGVDHCGHRYGPHHSAMTQKLTQMDHMLRSVINSIEKETILFVLGDHGMTKSGDHGGDSEDEISAALFIYSPQKLHNSKGKVEDEETFQIDLVPTISFLLGLPIPSANLGIVISDLMNTPVPQDHMQSRIQNLTDMKYKTLAIYINVLQVKEYLDMYVSVGDGFPLNQWDELSNHIIHIKQMLQKLQLNVNMDDNDLMEFLHKFHRECQDYLLKARSMCQAVWAKFDIVLILCGIVQILAVIVIGLFLKFNNINDLPHNLNILMCIISVIGFLTFTTLLISQVRLPNYLDTPVITLLCLFLLGSSVVIAIILLIAHLKSKFQFSLNSIFPTVLLLIYFFSIFSNSYTENETTVLCFLTLTSLLCSSHFSSRPINSEDQTRRSARHDKNKENSLTQRKIVLILSVLLFSGLIRLSLNFQKCREEQYWCEDSHFLRPLSSLVGDMAVYKNWRYFLSILSVCMLPFLLRRWLSSAGNLNGYTMFVLCAKYLLVLAAAAMCYHWALLALPQNLLRRLRPWQHMLAPRVVFILCGITILSFFISPLCVYLLPRKERIGPFYSADTTEIVHKVFNHLKVNWRKHLTSSSSSQGETSRETPIAYGLATVYSASVLILSSAIILIVMLLLGDGLVPSVILMVAAAVVSLKVVAITKAESSSNLYELFQVSWANVVTWGLLSSFFFFTTGHQATFPSLQWEAAFIGSDGEFSSYLIPAILVLLNTFASQVVFSLSIPLLVIWPFTNHVMYPQLGFQGALKEQTRRGEFLLYENEDAFNEALFKTTVDYFTFQGIKLMATMCAGAIHRRHLMVWKLFAPRFLFEAVATLLILPTTLLGFLLILRINKALSKWVQKLEHSH